MNSTSRFLPYEKTGMFSGLVLDYLKGKDEVKTLYKHPVDINGVRAAIEQRKAFPTDRALLADVFDSLYNGNAHPKQQQHIEWLRADNTFTICTAHQPNIFTGYLYFVYKILHAVRIAEHLAKELPEYHFVPVYYIGSEDNDLEELGQVKVDGVKLEWKTKQKGAVGSMKVDKDFLQLIAQLEGQLGVKEFGPELINMLRDAYQEGSTIAASTFRLVNHLFASYGLLVLIPGDPRFKKKMISIFNDDLFSHIPHSLVKQAGEKLHEHYKVQVNPREINLFYLEEGSRERIVEDGGVFKVENRGIVFTHAQIREELEQHPERFSPNVVLRAIFQETILPDIAFVGGGAETAYWLEMKELFDHYYVPYPILVLRNSFLVSYKEQEEKLAGFGFSVEDLFLNEFELMNKYVKAHSQNVLDVDKESASASKLFEDFKLKAAAVDHTLVQHIDALHTRLQKQIDGAGKKLLRAEKKKFDIQKQQLLKLKAQLFPNGSLQERVDNFMPYYAQHGKAFIDAVYEHSPAFDQQFVILSLSN
ncbi:MAG TPA: bacillithiol biosynthesis cysteine-adding enzyme BshC [Chitinophagaceae bacterium]|nr:bacillithiol biosynthesis cysteine-adding enzyme BshC [Chitinophagaceae bacterium]